MSTRLICIYSFQSHREGQMWGGKHQKCPIFFCLGNPWFQSSPHVRGPLSLSATLAQQSCPMGCYYRRSITRFHGWSEVSASLHKSIIYASCFPKIGIMKAPEQIWMLILWSVCHFIFLSLPGFYHPLSKQRTCRSEILFCQIFSFWILWTKLFKNIQARGTNAAY